MSIGRAWNCPVSPITVPIAAIEAAPTRPGSAHHTGAARIRGARLPPLADGTASRTRSRPRMAALDRRAVDALLEEIGMTWLTIDDGLTPLKKARPRDPSIALFGPGHEAAVDTV